MNENEKAELEFEQAVTKFINTRDPTNAEGIMVDWVLITAHHLEGEHMDSRTATAYGLYAPRRQPVHQGLGLLKYAMERVRNSLFSKD